MSARSQELRAVLFDVEGVIAHPDTAQADRELAALEPGLDLARLDRARQGGATYALWRRYSRGLLLGDDYWGPVVSEAGLEEGPELVRAVRAIYRRHWWGRLDDAVLRIADALRQAAAAEGRAIQLGLLSNSAPEHEPRIGTFAHRFDAALFSHRIGQRKPDPAAFQLAASDLDVAPEHVAFVDDKPRNTAAAAALGFHPLDFTDADTLRNDLTALGLLPR